MLLYSVECRTASDKLERRRLRMPRDATVVLASNTALNKPSPSYYLMQASIRDSITTVISRTCRVICSHTTRGDSSMMLG